MTIQSNQNLPVMTPNELLSIIQANFGPGCSIVNFLIIGKEYVVTGRKLSEGRTKANRMVWFIDTQDKTVSIYPLLPVLPGGETMTELLEVQ